MYVLQAKLYLRLTLSLFIRVCVIFLSYFPFPYIISYSPSCSRIAIIHVYIRIVQSSSIFCLFLHVSLSDSVTCFPRNAREYGEKEREITHVIILWQNRDCANMCRNVRERKRKLCNAFEKTTSRHPTACYLQQTTCRA